MRVNRNGIWGQRVTAVLIEIGFEIEREVCPFDKEDVEKYEIWEELFAIDLALRGRKIAIELDGPTHYLRGGGVDGSTLAKRRMLERLGWKILVVGEEESKMLEEEGMEKEKVWFS
eukprot:CAMPEP_0118635514 /NCGR_PEP_ID=MMETSP0785-20121206/2116_1 /TAXON_ID=91992 /ORGANISM="Bolidomonas pacifica, Strain CCMP 1866" /LENGTH=115 /DNA_ID=CAMNT_0006526551 /DNA_START=9 /DNA_END=353 /DNA_ORIENTATION=+